MKQPWLRLLLVYSAIAMGAAACGQGRGFVQLNSLNSQYSEEQPALSGNGRYLAFVSSRNGRQGIVLYDVQQQRVVDLPRINRRNAVNASPSLSYTGRYIAYIDSGQGRPELALYDRITQQTEILTTGYWGWVRNPSISPDGRYIAFESSRRGQWDIEVIDRGRNIELDLPDGVEIPEPPVP